MVTFEDIQAAHARIVGAIHRTPVVTCRAVDDRAGATVFFKCENFQKVGAFKARGAANAVFSLSDEEASHGVVTHSSGNHAQAVARAAKLRGIPAHIVMPRTAPEVKKDAVRGYGGIITECEPTLEARIEGADKIIHDRGCALVHPYNDPRIVAGQGTCALEFFEEVLDLDILLTPVGGGGLLSGSVIVAKHLYPPLDVYGCEPELADDAHRSFHAGHIVPAGPFRTVADGLLTSLGEVTFEIIHKFVNDILLVAEADIIPTMRFVWERTKLVIEPSSAVAVAPLFDAKHSEPFRGKRIGVILSGGNVDLTSLEWD